MTKSSARIATLTAAISVAVLLGGSFATAEEPQAPPQPGGGSKAGCVRGIELMSPEERTQYHAQMRGLSAEEHAKFMAAHHESMKARAAAKGVSLCSETMGPGPMGKGRGGPGSGKGPGGGPQSTD